MGKSGNPAKLNKTKEVILDTEFPYISISAWNLAKLRKLGAKSAVQINPDNQRYLKDFEAYLKKNPTMKNSDISIYNTDKMEPLLSHEKPLVALDSLAIEKLHNLHIVGWIMATYENEVLTKNMKGFIYESSSCPEFIIETFGYQVSLALGFNDETTSKVRERAIKGKLFIAYFTSMMIGFITHRDLLLAPLG